MGKMPAGILIVRAINSWLMLVRQLSIAAIFVVIPLGCRELEQPKEHLKKNSATPWEGAC
jgi:hypothetical protein